MKSRKTTYVLVVVVLLLWAWIAKKILSPGEQMHAYAVPAVKSESVKVADTLSLNYRDPFLRGLGAVQDVKQPRRSAGNTLLIKKNKEAPKIRIVYVGRVRCRTGELYIVDIEGRRTSLVKGESAEGLTLAAVRGGELVFTCGGNEYKVPITH